MTAHAAAFDSIELAIQTIAAGGLVIVTDDEDRENEGDLVMAATKATPETINIMIRDARGLLCVPTVEHQLKRLGLNPMVASNRESRGTDFTVSVDAADGITTGISAADRCRAVKILADPDATAEQLVQPGHVFPLRARPGGVLQRAGHTEAAVDLAVLAGQPPCGVICEILNEDGSVARLPELIEFKRKHGIPLISIEQLIQFRHEREKLVERVLTRPFKSVAGPFDLHVFRSNIDGRIHIALTCGQLDDQPTLVRVHSENILGDAFLHLDHSHDGRGTLELALRKIASTGKGVFLYMTQPNLGIDLSASASGDPATVQTMAMDFRAYGIGAQILSELGIKRIRLLSSSQRKHVGLEGYGLEIVEQIPLT